MSDKKRVFTVLVIDGGGVRGILPARILEHIEHRTGRPIAESFDMIGGVSTGAIIAGGLSVPDPENPTKPKYSAEKIKQLYFEHAPRIFPEMRFKALRQISSSAAYDPRPIEDTLYTYFGETQVKDSLIHLMIPATDIKNFRPAWINSFKGEKDLSPEGWSTMLMRDAIRVATTAPTYFPAKYVTTTPDEENAPEVQHRHTLIDGGFFSGNAMRRMLTQARRLAPADAEIVVVHVGTGMVGNSMSPEEWNKLGPLGMLSKQNGSPLMSLAVNISILDMADDLRDELGDRFMSFNGNIDYQDKISDPSTEMDNASIENMKRIERFADRIISENADEFNRLCRMLDDKIFAEQTHTQSRAALQQIVKKMEALKTVKALTRSYRLVLKAASDLSVTSRTPEDAELIALARQLNQKHRDDLDKMYNVMQDRLENRNQVMNSMREAVDSADRFLKKLGGGFNDAANDRKGDDKNSKGPDDNLKPPPAGLQRGSAQPKRWWDRR